MVRIKRKYRLVVTIFLIGLFFTGCGLLRARPDAHRGFLPKPELVMEHRERAPFHAYWVFDPKQYEDIRETYAKVYIAPIDISVVQKMFLEARGEEKTKRMRVEEAEELARYFRERIRVALESREERRIIIVDAPGSNILSLKLALVGLIPTNPGINIIGTAAGFFVPGGGLIKLAGEGSVAMEGFVEEERQDKPLYEQFKDREGQKSSPFTLKDYQRYAHIRIVLDDWSEQLAELLVTPAEHTVDDSIPVSIDPL